MKMEQDGEVVRVFYVERLKAKTLKNVLEKEGILNKDFRLHPDVNGREWMAIPVVEGESFDHAAIIEEGRQFCKYSTALLGNHMQRTARKNKIDAGTTPPSLVQRAIWMAGRSDKIDDEEFWRIVKALPINVCPRNMELLGDDNTVVVNRSSFDPNDPDFRKVIDVVQDQDEIFAKLWESLAMLYKSKRVVRKGIIDPDSPVRESGYRLLWPYSGTPAETGPRSPAWITVTEQGIRQSFDLSRVMFSRGNITEKIRFGKLVQRGEIVLDLYAGIGYFSLPALVHGEAEHLFACEWNEYAIEALRFNLHDNEVDSRASVFHGDCRVIAEQNDLVDKVDRVSLGLLPSSEGGWRTAVRALRRSTGGWLHVHGNVKVSEVIDWALWMSQKMLKYVHDIEMSTEWKVVCTHIEKVKSFAPTVAHYVADVYIGPDTKIAYNVPVGRGELQTKDGKVIKFDLGTELRIPSCAISPDGPISQEWMAEVNPETTCNRI